MAPTPFLVMADPAGAPWCWPVIRALAACPGIDDLTCHVKVGLELPVYRHVVNVVQPREDDLREHASYTLAVPFTAWARQQELLAAAYTEAFFDRAPSGPVTRPRGDLVVLSDMPRETAAALADALSQDERVWAATFVDLSEPIVWDVAWSRLLTVGVFLSGRWLRTVSDDGTLEYEAVLEAAQSGCIDDEPSEAEFGFVDEGRILNIGDIFLAPERRFAGLGLPVEPRPRRTTPAMVIHETVQQKALHAVTGARRPTKPAYGLDDPQQTAWFQLPEVARQLPDAPQVLSKVRDYCLNPGHPDRKFDGFARLGYSPSPDHAYALGYQLLSAVLHPEARPHRTRLGSDGALLFEVHTLVSGPRKAGPVVAAWNQRAGEPLRLSTAYVSNEAGDEPLSPTAVLPADLDETNDALYRFARSTAESAGMATAADFGLAVGVLIVPHTDDRSRGFGLWARRTGVGRPARSRKLGTHTRVSLGLRMKHADELEVAHVHAATVLNLAGVRCTHEIILV
ncbi:MAG: hypothetical protein KY447_05520 [Actinobacteria bacterium]|nr:hypothetical protein [Actinomycetota bacterium]